jgi:hypothetical protein
MYNFAHALSAKTINIILSLKNNYRDENSKVAARLTSPSA